MVLRLGRTLVSGFPPVRLGRGRLYLRPPAPGDWEEWAKLREASAAFLTPWEPLWPVDALTRPSYQHRLRRQLSEWRAGEGYHFLIFREDDDRMLGGLSLTNVRRGVAQTAVLGYWVGEAFARQGVMSEAVKAALKFAFGELELHRVEAACLPRNEPSRRLLEKLGFRREGSAKAYLRIAGRWEDHLLFAMLAEEQPLD
jgi:ribosomal-protein-alanine N-acetyltransferase